MSGSGGGWRRKPTMSRLPRPAQSRRPASERWLSRKLLEGRVERIRLFKPARPVRKKNLGVARRHHRRDPQREAVRQLPARDAGPRLVFAVDEIALVMTVEHVG